MSPNQLRTQTSDTQIHTRRRRHAAPGHPAWVRRAGLVGGVVSVLALSGAAAPAMADNTRPSTTDTASLPTIAEGAQQAAAAFEQDAIAASLTAAQDKAAADAVRNAVTRKAAEAKAAAAAKAARAARWRAAAARAAAARAAEQAKLNASPVAAVAAPSSWPSSNGSSVSNGSSGSSGSAGSVGSSSSAPAVPVPTTPVPAVPVPAAPVPAAPAAPAPVTPPSSSKVDQLIAFLKAQVGKPYVYGATGPSSYDCSGLTQAAFASVGITLPRTSQAQSTVGTPVSLGALQPGDLLFWGGRGSAYHVGVFIGNGQYLDAANPSTPVGIHPMTYYMPDWAVAVL